jgi:hypothetical protein
VIAARTLAAAMLIRTVVRRKSAKRILAQEDRT